MNPMKTARKIELSSSERQQLERWSRGRSTAARLVLRSKIVLLAAAGTMNKDIARQLNTSRKTVSLWRTRFAEQRVAGIEQDAPRPGRKPRISAAAVQRIVRKTTQERPANATHWSVRSMAQAVGVSKATVQRIWSLNGLKPHLVKTFKVSNDPRFAEKLLDVVGLYLNPPEHAIVLCADEKSQIQALDRTQKSLPLFPGRLKTMTHDYKRNGTTTLFAALNVADGKVIGSCKSQHRHQEWIQFLKQIDAETPRDLDLHVILDNYATHKHPKVKAWLAKHPRFHMHFIPTSSSWLNLVERWFREISEKRIRRESFTNVAELVETIQDFLEHNNENPRPFVWTASAERILEKYRRARALLDKTPSV
jgi:transposase